MKGTDMPGDPTMRDVPARPPWTDDELRTLIRFRARVGRRWKSRLLDLYLSGRDDGEPEGSALRRIRNRQGPSRVHALRASVLDEAEARLAPQA
jgi:hypothetical protein